MMMTAILLESRNAGESAWVKVAPHYSAIQITGMKTDDLLELEFWNGDVELQRVKENCSLPIPDHCVRIRVIHAHVSGSPVSVDLI